MTVLVDAGFLPGSVYALSPPISEVHRGPNQPMMVFVAQITLEDRAKAMEEAYRRAKTNAEQIAHAAGVRIGPLEMQNEALGVDPGHVSFQFTAVADFQLQMDAKPAPVAPAK